MNRTYLPNVQWYSGTCQDPSLPPLWRRSVLAELLCRCPGQTLARALDASRCKSGTTFAVFCQSVVLLSGTLILQVLFFFFAALIGGLEITNTEDTPTHAHTLTHMCKQLRVVLCSLLSDLPSGCVRHISYRVSNPWLTDVCVCVCVCVCLCVCIVV